MCSLLSHDDDNVRKDLYSSPEWPHYVDAFFPQHFRTIFCNSIANIALLFQSKYTFFFVM